MDHPTTIRLKASIQTLVFVILLAATLFGSAGRFDIIEFWVYIAIVVGASVSSLIILDSDLMQERMQPGGHRVACTSCRLLLLYFCIGPWRASTMGTSISVMTSRPVRKSWRWPCLPWLGLCSSGLDGTLVTCGLCRF
jgi:hypothetical protein